MSPPKWDDNKKKITKELILLFIAFLVGVIILLPSLSSIIQPPHVAKWALLLFICSALLAFIFLCFALYFTFTESQKAPHISHGIGTNLTILSFIFIAIYLSGNILSGTNSSPTITDIFITPLNPKCHTTIRLNGVAQDKDKDILKYSWIIDEEKISTERFAYYYITKCTSPIKVTLTVEDSSENISEKSILFYLSK